MQNQSVNQLVNPFVTPIQLFNEIVLALPVARSLDPDCISSSAVVLPPDPRLAGQDCFCEIQGVRAETKRGCEKPNPEILAIKKGGLKVPRISLPPDSYRAFRFTTPISGLASYWVAANRNVSTFVVDADGLDAFKRGETVPCYGGFSRRLSHSEQVSFDYYGRWWLIISNRTYRDVDVEYEVFT